MWAKQVTKLFTERRKYIETSILLPIVCSKEESKAVMETKKRIWRITATLLPVDSLLATALYDGYFFLNIDYTVERLVFWIVFFPLFFSYVFYGEIGGFVLFY